jgi:uncharacterized protein
MNWDFYGRADTLESMRELVSRGRWFFARVQGRRRIGKTELLRHLARSDAKLDASLVYMQVPDSDERDVVSTFRRALRECDNPWIRAVEPSVTDFLTMARAIGQLCRRGAIVVLDEFQYFVRPTLYPFNSFLQAEVDALRDTTQGGLFVLGSLQTEMTALLADRSAPLYGRATELFNVEHWDFEDLLQVFVAQGVHDPSAWLTLWSFFEGVPKFYRDAHHFDVLRAPAHEIGQTVLSKLFLDGSSPLKDEAENWFLRELKGKSVSIIRYLAEHPGSYAGDLAAELSKTSSSAELGSYLAALTTKYKMVEKRLPVFAESKSRSARYFLTDNFLQACLAVISPAVNTARIRPVERALLEAAPRLQTLEGHAFEKLIRNLHVECSRKGKGDFALTSQQIGYWNKPRDTSRSIEIDVVALDDESKKVRFGSCKRSAASHTGSALKDFKTHVDAFLKTKEGKRVASWTHEYALFSPTFEAVEKSRLQATGFTCIDLRTFAGYLRGTSVAG